MRSAERGVRSFAICPSSAPRASGFASEVEMRWTRLELNPANSGRRVTSRQVTRSGFSRTALRPENLQESVAALLVETSESGVEAHPHANANPARTVNFRIPIKLPGT